MGQCTGNAPARTNEPNVFGKPDRPRDHAGVVSGSGENLGTYDRAAWRRRAHAVPHSLTIYPITDVEKKRNRPGCHGAGC